VSPAARYAGNELRASPEHDVPTTPITALLAATPGAMFAATVRSHCESALISSTLTAGFFAFQARSTQSLFTMQRTQQLR